MIYITTSKFQADFQQRLDALLVLEKANRTALAAVAKQLDLLTEFHIQIDERMRYMQRAWDEVVAEVNDLKSLPDAVKAGFDALEAKLAAAIDAAANAVSVDDVNKVKADVAKAVADIRGAIPANVS